MANWRRSHHWFPPSVPREAKGGIKSQSRRGGFGESWWAKRWIEVLESFDIGARLSRGRSYARRGQVLNIAIAKGEVTAQVQGSRPRPYAVSIKIKVISPAGWRKLVQAMGAQAFFAAELLAGKMPEKIEETFQQVDLSLFPQRLKDLETKCSCPDWSNPCKHIAAVYFLLGEEFDRDPFLLFKLRGLTREELMERLSLGGGKSKAKAQAAPVREKAEISTPVSSDPSVFWIGGQTPEDMLGDVSAQLGEAALVKRLGSFPLWRGERRFLDAMEEIYKDVVTFGVDVLAGCPN